MEQENPTTGDSGASTLDRLESFLSADEAPAVQNEPSVEDVQQKADAPATEATDEVDAKEQDSETPNEYQLSDVAKLLGAEESALEVGEDGAITVKTKIDGQDGKVKFADLIKSYQLQGHVDKQVREAAEVRKQAQEYAQQVQQQTQVQQAVVGKIAEAKAIETELAQYQGINWNALIDSDPVQAVKLDRQMRTLQDKHQTTINEVNQAAQYVQQQQAQQSEASLAIERQALLNAVPEWGNDATATKDKQAIFADLKARGYSERDIQGLSDHKAVLLARDAMLYRQQQENKSATEKVVRAAPKIVKPGSSQTVNRQANNIQNLKTSVRNGKSGSVAEYLIAAGIV